MKIFLYGLALLFIGLKLTGHISDWSWWTVLSPLISVQINEFLIGFMERWKEDKKKRIAEKRIIEQINNMHERDTLSNFERKMEDLKKSKGDGGFKCNGKAGS